MAEEDDPPFAEGGSNGNRRRPHFHVFTNPLEMERFFNHQMDEMLKSFGLFGPGSNGNERGSLPGFPSIDIPGQFHPNSENQDGNAEKGSRDFMLKEDSEDMQEKLKRPGYIEPDSHSFGFWNNGRGKASKREDSDMDGEGSINTAELNELFKRSPEGPQSNQPQPPHSSEIMPNNGGSIFGGIFGNFGSSPFSSPFRQIQVNYMPQSIICDFVRPRVGEGLEGCYIFLPRM